jgi:3-deoxy-D-manno-octulosonic-acid transferase
VSVGEVNLLAPLLSTIARQRPDWECVISTTTMTGMALARKKYPSHLTFYCPLDFSWAVRRAVRRIRPSVLVLTELELWPNLISAARRNGARVAVINGRLGQQSYAGYLRIRPLAARWLQAIDLLAAQDGATAARFESLGARPESLCVTGSMKYDGAVTDRNNPATQRLRRLAGFAEDDIVLLAGSTQDPEEAMALAAYRDLCDRWPRLRLVLVPRHPDRFDAVARLLDASGVAWQRRTLLEQTSGNNASRILLVDVVGELGAWWGTAQIAFVGGSFGTRGGQNMIEPAAYGAAVSFGPNTRNFRDIVAALRAADAAVVVGDDQQFVAFVRRCLDEPAYAAALGDRARCLVREQVGATDRTFELLAKLLPTAASPASADRAAA